jgi:hypothetical protein
VEVVNDEVDTMTGCSGYEKPDKKCEKDRYWMEAQSKKAQAMSEKVWRESRYYTDKDLRETRARSRDDDEPESTATD